MKWILTGIALAALMATPVAAERKFCDVRPSIWVRYETVVSPP